MSCTPLWLSSSSYLFNFSYLLRLIVTSGEHGTFSLSADLHAQNIVLKFLLRKSQEEFDAGIVKKLRKFQLKKLFYRIKNRDLQRLSMSEL